MKDDSIKVGSSTLYRIRALRNFEEVDQDDLGGYVQSEDNLSHEGTCWIYHNDKVYGDAKLYDYAKVYDKAKIYNNVTIEGTAEIYGSLTFISSEVITFGKIKSKSDYDKLVSGN